MKGKVFFKAGFFVALVTIGFATYFWYLHFTNNKNDSLDNVLSDLEFLSGSNINYLDAKVDDIQDTIPVYYFRIKNNGEKNIEYKITFKQTMANDGCTTDTTFLPSELEFELKLNGVVKRRGTLDQIKNEILDNGTIEKNTTKDYYLKIWLNEQDEQYVNKHFHYVVNAEEIYEKK